MSRQQFAESDQIHHVYGVDATALKLNLTAQRGRLREGEFSVLKGLDVIHPGRLAPDGGRKPIDEHPSDLHADGVSFARGIGWQGSTSVFFAAHFGVSKSNTEGGATYTETGGTLGDFELFDAGLNDEIAVGEIVTCTQGTGDEDFVGLIAIVVEVATDRVRLDRSWTGADSNGANLSLTFFPAPVDRPVYYVLAPQAFDVSFAFPTLRIMKSPTTLAQDGAWPSDMVGATLTINSDARFGDTETFRIDSISTVLGTDDTLVLNKWSANYRSDDAVVGDKFSITYQATQDKRGIWVTDGQTIYLLSQGTYVKYLKDTGWSSGADWYPTRIASNLVMFCHEEQAPRIVRLDAVATTETTVTTASLAGMLEPRRPLSSESQTEGDSAVNKSWGAQKDTAGGGDLVNGGVYRVRVRAVNLNDNAESRFVDAWDHTDLDNLAISAPGTNGHIDIHSHKHFGDCEDGSTERRVDPPLFHERWTHIEIWRTVDAGTTYWLERRIEVTTLFNEYEDSGSPLGPFDVLLGAKYTYPLLAEDSDFNQTTCTLSDAALVAAGTQASSADLAYGYAPPICQQAASLAGVTFCFGKASADAVDPTAYAYGNAGWDIGYVHADKEVGPYERWEWDTGDFWYQFEAGDILNVTYADGNGVIGDYLIVSKDDVTGTLTLDTSIGSTVTTIHGSIKRGYSIPWQRIEDDETFWYSRTDTFAPESFSPLFTKTLSSTGDTFRRAVNVGNYVCVLMKQGVHLIYMGGLLGITPVVDTISAVGFGTPWKNSVAVYGDIVFWATRNGAMMMAVTNDVDNSGHRGRIQPLGGAERPIQQWFIDAYDAGMTVDAVVDSHNQAVRFRRHDYTTTNSLYEGVQYGMVTGMWTQLDDDSGVVYASSDFADETEDSEDVTYSITPEGNPFIINDYSNSHPYDGLLVADNLATYTVTTTRITSTGDFNDAMEGDIIRFASTSDTSIDGAVRRITGASNNQIVFEEVVGLDTDKANHSFTIGVSPFAMRSAPIHGNYRGRTKTLDGITIVASPGPRQTVERGGGSDDWPDPPTGMFTVKGYENLAPSATKTATNDVGIFDEDDVDKVDSDRESTLELDGRSFEIEISLNQPRNDFRIDRIDVSLDEVGDESQDVSTTS